MARGADRPVQLSQTRPAALWASTRMRPRQGPGRRQAGAVVTVITNTAGGLVHSLWYRDPDPPG